MSDPTLDTPETFPAHVIHIDALPHGTMLAEFEILGLLGVGGFGMVYRAYDHSLHRTVAIKEYMPTALVGRAVGTALTIRSSVDHSSFSAGLKSFVAEARLLARFDHPSLVKVYRFWEANNTAYMAMPLYIGMTLKQARSQMQSPPSEVWLRQVLWSVLDALKVLHETNTLHRDVSPDNIFLQDLGPPVLLDLGSARRALLDTSHRHTAVLKVNYAPIEQYADAGDLVQGPWTDLYSVAAVVHGCLCNEPPLPATFRVVRDRLPKIANVAKTVMDHFGQSYSAGFVAAIDHALAIQPDARPRSVDAMLAELRLSRPGDMSKFVWRVDPGMHVAEPNRHQRQLPESLPSVLSTTGEQKTRVQTAVAPARRSSTSGKKMTVWLMGVGAILLAATGLFLNPLSDPLPAQTKLAQVAVVPSKEAPDASRTPMPEAVVVAPPPAVVKRPVPPLSVKPVPTALPGAPSPPAQKLPVVLCADSNFVTRPMCIHLECQKAQFASLSICAENRQRYSENSERSNP